MYTIKQAAARSGVSVPLLRAWERRYHVVAPARTASGYRLYDEPAISRLRAMRRLVADGWSPSAAADRLASMPDSAIADDRVAGRSDPAPGGGDPAFEEAFVDAAARLDDARVERLLDEAFGRGSFEHVAETQVLPALEALGAAWASGRVDVAGEHAASHAVLRRLSAAYQAAGRAAPERPILVGLPPGARHELGALAFAAAARRAGLPILYLGADLPVQDWIDAATRTRARAVVVGAITGDDRDAASRVARALHAARPDLLIAFGGRGAPDPQAFAGLGQDGASRNAIRLPNALGESVAVLSAALGFAAPP
ncbi:MAG TPA: MerR family transcriptional regulator [Candidatus Limnocylindrales bacterium]|nr:MerR family transcriptional regulator [Candidatus Limnocylindrales bacterium]